MESWKLVHESNYILSLLNWVCELNVHCTYIYNWTTAYLNLTVTVTEFQSFSSPVHPLTCLWDQSRTVGIIRKFVGSLSLSEPWTRELMGHAVWSERKNTLFVIFLTLFLSLCVSCTLTRLFHPNSHFCFLFRRIPDPLFSL